MQLGADFSQVLKQIEENTGLAEDVIVSSIEAAMVSAYKKFKSGNTRIEVNINANDGLLTINEVYSIVEAVSNRDSEMTPDEAQRRSNEASKRSEAARAAKNNEKAAAEEKIAAAFNGVSVGDEVRVEVFPKNFGRIAAQTARQVIIQKMKDAERQVVFEQFASKIGNIVNGTVVRFDGEQVVVRLNDKTEAIMPKEEHIAGEKYIPDKRMKFYLLDVRQTTRGPVIVVSRSHPNLLRRMLEIEIPEIKDGIVEIRSIAREAGTRSKVAVASLDVNVEPLGACLGKQGSRIKSISNELNGERVDIIPYSKDPLKYIVSAISPAKAVKIEPLLDQDRSVIVYVHSDELSLAIGKAGQNVRLAAHLTGWKIDIKVKNEEKMPTMKDLFTDMGDSQDFKISKKNGKKEVKMPVIKDLFEDK